MNLAHNLKLKRHSIEHFHAPYRTSDWSARRDSNPRPSESESAAISSFATGGKLNIMLSTFFKNVNDMIKHREWGI